jgi:hypothetical protein
MPASSPIDLIDTLLEQHERIRELIDDIAASQGGSRAEALEELRELLALHETGEGYLAGSAGPGDEAAGLTARLDRLDPDGSDFPAEFARFAAEVRAHADREEREDFPEARATHSPDELHDLGNKLLKAERGTLDT